MGSIGFGREIASDLSAGLRREWITTNGLGGYASGTVAGPLTRRYHGLLVAALTPPVDRTVLVAGSVETVTYAGREWPISTHEFAGSVAPEGYRHLERFALEGLIPTWTYAVADALVERRVWMLHGANTTYLQFRLVRGDSATLSFIPLVTYRDFHSLSSGQGWRPEVSSVEHGVEVRAGARPCRILSAAAASDPAGEWWWNFHHREEAARGLDDRSDLFAVARFTATLTPDQSVTFVLSTDPEPCLDGSAALAAEHQRQADLLDRAAATPADRFTRQLVLAADQFLVVRAQRDQRSAISDQPSPDPSTQIPPSAFRLPPSFHSSLFTLHPSGTVIAGYHWFNDWGRDTMIALPGLTLATGRAPEMAGVLRSFAGYLVDGLLPNNFPDHAGIVPGYNTADATLWYVIAILRYERETGDRTLADDLLPALRSIVEWHERGTRHGIGVDPADGLLRAGEPGVQVTWMDAKVGDWVVTPRIGKPVEINALWYNALAALAELLAARGDADSASLLRQAERVRTSFRSRFLRDDQPGLADVVDGPAGDDWSFRPNQVFAISLPFPLVDGEDARRIVRAIGERLYTGVGLRSLDPADPAYRGTYGGDPLRRDGAYHQGPVWSWLAGPYAEAHYLVHGDAATALSLLRPLADHLSDAGLGSISEIFEGDAPHLPRGCIAQAWGVAETLRVWRMLTGA